MLHAHESHRPQTEIKGIIEEGETFSDIFIRYGLSLSELFEIGEASASTHNIARLYTGRPYCLRLDSDNKVSFLSYGLNDRADLNIVKTQDGFVSCIVPIEYEHRIRVLEGEITDNLVSSMDSVVLALSLSDIFAWDIDFTTGLRKGDTYKVIVEELWLDGKFFKYDKILAAQFNNASKTYKAYRYEQTGVAEYFDEQGGALRKSLLKAPLSYRRISSHFSRRRFHPILKRYRPHLGVDYSASRGTPVSSVGEGKVLFAARKGPNGKLVIIRHPGGYTTYYGHLHKIARGIRRGANVTQGQVIGQVGSTGRATGPHLDYRVKKNGKFLNPLKLKLPKGRPVNKLELATFNKTVEDMDKMLTDTGIIARTDKGTEQQESSDHIHGKL